MFLYQMRRFWEKILTDVFVPGNCTRKSLGSLASAAELQCERALFSLAIIVFTEPSTMLGMQEMLKKCSSKFYCQSGKFHCTMMQ